MFAPDTYLTQEAVISCVVHGVVSTAYTVGSYIIIYLYSPFLFPKLYESESIFILNLVVVLTQDLVLG